MFGLVRAALPGLLQVVMELATPDLAPGLATVARRCPACDHLMRMHSLRARTVRTIGGRVTLRRPYSRCASCGQGFCPADRALALTTTAHLSAGLRAWVVALGATTPYREAAGVLARLTGLVVAADTIRAHTTTAGHALVAADAAARATVQATRAAAEPVAAPPGALVVETEGVLVRSTDGWHEVKVGLVGGVVDEAVRAPS